MKHFEKMFLGLIFIVLIPNTVSTPVLQGNEEKGNFNEKEKPQTPCLLPQPFKLNEGGIEEELQNCLSFHLYEQYPPKTILGYHGIRPKICCPQEAVTLFPEELEKLEKQYGSIIDEDDDSANGSLRYDYYSYDIYSEEAPKVTLADIQEFSAVYDVPQVSDVEGHNDYESDVKCEFECVSHKNCVVSNQEKELPNVCGFDYENGEDLFCCKNKTAVENEPVAPQYGNYECRDFHSHCPKMLQLEPAACNNDFESSQFMRIACMKTCNKCGDKGCVDEFENCKEWSMKGHCAKFPFFMVYNCRESCGTCGFRSDAVLDSQVIKGKDYSNVSTSNFFCGFSNEKKITQRKVNLFGEELRLPTPGILRPLPSPKKRFGLRGEELIEGNIRCSSVLVNDRFILTAAHCETKFITQNDIRSVVLRPGTEYAEVIELKRSFIHPSYKFPLSYNDISLSEVGRRILFDFDKYGDSPICCNQVENLEGQTALVQGFGLTESGEQSGEVPLQTNVTIISNLDCANILRHNISLNHIDKVKLIDEKNGALKHGINDALLCSTGFEEDGFFSGPCQGDSGGPLMYEEDTSDGVKRTLIGTVSAGLSCGKNTPSWYTRVSEFAPWIDCIVNAANSGFSTKTINYICSRAAKLTVETKNSLSGGITF